MKLGTLSSTQRDGQLIVVSKDNKRAVRVQDHSLKSALEHWTELSSDLLKTSEQLNAGKHPEAFDLDMTQCLAPLPNAPGFYDGSAFLSHVVRARKARGDVMPESARVTPLMYQGVSDNLLSYRAAFDLLDIEYGGDFEAEFGVITRDVPVATPSDKVGSYIVLVTMLNDLTFREIVKTEIMTKFGFLQSKPNSAFAPFVVTPDELGAAWSKGRVIGKMDVRLNGALFGDPDGKEMNFSFDQLVAHACRTRPLSAGSIIGSGTVSNESNDAGFACLTEKRFQETIDEGKPTTGWLRPGDKIDIDYQLNGVSVFGPIQQSCVLGA